LDGDKRLTKGGHSFGGMIAEKLIGQDRTHSGLKKTPAGRSSSSPRSTA
jgi:hypothetical protein